MINDIKYLENLAKQVRVKILDIITTAKSSHLGCSFSIVEILIVLYYEILDITLENWRSVNRERFILSKGHACAALYTVLWQKGFITEDTLNTYYQNGSLLGAHPSLDTIPGIEASTGSLGHGLSIGCGLAYANKLNNLNKKVYVLIGDGECNEGTIWEAALFANHHRLNNLIVILDRNKIQGYGYTEEIIKLEPLQMKWQSFGWNVLRVNGHDITLLVETFNSIQNNEGPTIIIADTLHGKCVDFLENKLEWHYRSPTEEEFKKAKECLV
ncbi:MAG: transketolase [bacterium]